MVVVLELSDVMSYRLVCYLSSLSRPVLEILFVLNSFDGLYRGELLGILGSYLETRARGESRGETSPVRGASRTLRAALP